MMKAQLYFDQSDPREIVRDFDMRLAMEFNRHNLIALVLGVFRDLRPCPISTAFLLKLDDEVLFRANSGISSLYSEEDTNTSWSGSMLRDIDKSLAGIRGNGQSAELQDKAWQNMIECEMHKVPLVSAKMWRRLVKAALAQESGAEATELNAKAAKSGTEIAELKQELAKTQEKITVLSDLVAAHASLSDTRRAFRDIEDRQLALNTEKKGHEHVYDDLKGMVEALQQRLAKLDQ